MCSAQVLDCQNRNFHADAQSFVRRLNAAVEVRGLSQKDLANRIGIDPSLVSRTLTGDRKIDARNELKYWLEILEIDFYSLIAD